LINYIKLCLIFSIVINACKQDVIPTDRFAHISDDNAREIIRSSIAHAGGIDKWESIKQLKYTKDFSLLLDDGTVEKSYEQVHNYNYDPIHLDIRSKENGDLIHTQFLDGKYSRTKNGESLDFPYSRNKNGESLDVPSENLIKAMNTSTYVIGMPFKLLDPGVEISYEGELFLENETLVDVIKVSYDPVKNKNHSTADVWKYYFDKEDRKIVGNWVNAGDHANVIENLSYVRVGGILFNKERKSYRLDSLGKKEFVRADYFYDNYEVEF